MKIRLLDYAGNKYWVRLPEDTQVVYGLVVSGDMVMNAPVLNDTGDGSRIDDYIEGYWKVDVQQLEDFNKIKESYDALKYGYN